MNEPSLDNQWGPMEAEVRALVMGWNQVLGGPPKDDLTRALLETYNALDRREAQIAKLQPTVQYVEPLHQTLTALLVERDRLRARLVDLYSRWRAAHQV